MKETIEKIKKEDDIAVVKTKTAKNISTGPSVEEMTEAGLQFGHKTSKLNPKMKSFLYGARNGINVFDLEKTKEKFEGVLKFVKEIVSQGKIILFVGTKIQIKNSVKETAQECKMPYVSERWLGGTLTNFPTITKRIEYFKELERKKAAGELEKYTKKERAQFNKELSDLERKFSGIRDMTVLPDAVFVIDAPKDDLVIKEAKSKNITIIGIADTNCNPDWFDYFIPANDDSISSVRFVLDKVKNTILKNKSETKTKPE